MIRPMSNRPPHPGQIRIRLTESDPCLAMNEAWKPRCCSHFGHTRKSSSTSSRLISSLTFYISRYCNMLLRKAASVRPRRTNQGCRRKAATGIAVYFPPRGSDVAGIVLMCWETTNLGGRGGEERGQR